MLAFALISEVPFDIGFFSRYSIAEGTFPFYLQYQNVFFTLFLVLSSTYIASLWCIASVQIRNALALPGHFSK